MSVASWCSTYFVTFCALFVYGPFCHGDLKLDISTLLTTLIFLTSLQFILNTCVIFINYNIFSYNWKCIYLYLILHLLNRVYWINIEILKVALIADLHYGCYEYYFTRSHAKRAFALKLDGCLLCCFTIEFITVPCFKVSKIICKHLEGLKPVMHNNIVTWQK